VAIPEQRLSTMVLVIGTGGAGLRAAIELAEAGVDVLAVGKRPKEDAHTALAAGGINAALATMDPEDSWQEHAADTLKESYQVSRASCSRSGRRPWPGLGSASRCGPRMGS
jgi:succinate dehydrogenase / fumarate reductase flavoprotein subunit